MNQEKKNRRSGILISISLHVIVLIAFLFILAWRAPDPPLPEYGIELNFGLDNVGTGDVQPETPANESQSEEEAAPEELPEESVEEEAVEPAEEAVEEVLEPVDEVIAPVENTQESPDVVEEVKKEESKPVVKEEKKEEKPKDTPKPPVEKKEPVKPENGADGKGGESKEVKASNQGDNIDKTGDKGDPQGTLNSDALYGKTGGGGGSSLNMTGWAWDFIPKPKDTSSETGRLVFEIKIDDQGEILSVKKIEGTVSSAVEKVYRAEVEKLTFSKTSDNTIVAPISTGRITFVIKSK